MASKLQNPKRFRKVSLSLCMIVKNEAATLEKCLRLARPQVDEIVIVDTGSTDGTKEIAKRYADIYDEIEWPGSFSVARNYSLDLATCEYIMILDGDEYIPDQRHWKKIQKSLKDRNTAVIQLLVRNLLREGHIISADRVWQERIFLNHPDMRYFGKVHNQIQERMAMHMRKTGRIVQQVPAEVIHTGYALTTEQMKEKYRPRLQLLEAEYYDPIDAKYKAYYGYQLGLAFFILEEFEKAAIVFNEIDYSLMLPMNAFYTRLLGAQTGIRLKNSAMALNHCNEMFKIDQDEPIAYFSCGLSFIVGGDMGNGMLMLLEAFDVSERMNDKARFILNPFQLLQVLARACRQSGLQDHGKAFQAMYDKKKFNPKVVRAMVASLKTGIVLAEREAA